MDNKEKDAEDKEDKNEGEEESKYDFDTCPKDYPFYIQDDDSDYNVKKGIRHARECMKVAGKLRYKKQLTQGESFEFLTEECGVNEIIAYFSLKKLDDYVKLKDSQSSTNKRNKQ